MNIVFVVAIVIGVIAAVTGAVLVLAAVRLGRAASTAGSPDATPAVTETEANRESFDDPSAAAVDDDTAFTDPFSTPTDDDDELEWGSPFDDDTEEEPERWGFDGDTGSSTTTFETPRD